MLMHLMASSDFPIKSLSRIKTPSVPPVAQLAICSTFLKIYQVKFTLSSTNVFKVYPNIDIPTVVQMRERHLTIELINLQKLTRLYKMEVIFNPLLRFPPKVKIYLQIIGARNTENGSQHNYSSDKVV
ncbi:hypothetical protein C5167_034501 [Papaver somniferum]|uniref:Uncharacterized protein n=1 Tax=Papaver somniferum TaxID=3469 RepID=A0A4Y7KEQ9_PAPSO|nr:hypothetical protein C5167_034501 [Papaver somniferum]